jgi:phospholipase/carboxylesterase
MREAVLGGLKTRMVGGTDGDGAGKGPLVILLHGFGAPGTDLVPLADFLAAPVGTRFLFPEGPLSLSMGYGDSRAWWLIDMARLEADLAAGRMRDLSKDVPRGLPPAREAIERFLNDLPRLLPIDYKRTVIGGFSQGAMLSCDVVMRKPIPFAGMVQLSGTLLARQDWQPSVAKRAGLPVFQSHGMQDSMLPFMMAERLRDELKGTGLTVEWHSFRGGHEIPGAILDQLSLFLMKVLKAS